MFCENCGYDFITGSLPTGDDAVHRSVPSFAPPRPSTDGSTGGSTSGSGPMAAASASTTGPDSGPAAQQPAVESAPPSVLDPDSGGVGPGPVGGEVPRLRVAVAADRAFFDQMVTDDEIDFPDPAPMAQEIDLAGTELHIGRTSDSRAIHPDIDVADLTDDQAVSSRHAVLRVANDGTFTITDVGSTNGTFLDAVDSDRLTAGVPVEVKPGVPIFVGAWTRLTIMNS
jgi:hypothetical protein